MNIGDKLDALIVALRRSAWQKTILFRFMRAFLLAVAGLFLVFVMNRIMFPVYRQTFAENLVLEIVCTGEQNETALDNNVRLSGITVNGVSMNLSKVELSGCWQYSPIDDFLYNYDASQLDPLRIVLENVISMELSFVSEYGSGMVQVNVNGETWELLDLYSDNSWSLVSAQYDTSVLVNPEQHFWLCLLIFVLLFVLALAFEAAACEKCKQIAAASAADLLLQVVLSLVIVVSCLFLQYQAPENLTAFLQRDHLVVMEGYILVFLLLHVLYWITQSHWLSFGVLGLVLEVLVVVSNIKQNARGTPLLPWDFQMAGAALSVADEYDLSVSVLTVLVLLCALIVALALFQSRNRKSRFPFRRAAIGTAMILCGFIFYVQTTVFCGVWNITSSNRVYQVSQYYESNGFIVSFAEYVNYLLPQREPDGYSKETMQALVEEIQAECHDEDQTVIKENLPNIIAIMSESFWDVTTLENVAFAEDPIPYYRALLEESIHGDMLSHVFGGNTVISEYEFLTGFHAAFFPEDYMVYGSCLGTEFQSAATVLAEQGYHTMAIHPYEKTNYNRNTAYETLGFQQMLFEDSFAPDAKRIRSYISDEAMYQEVIAQYEQLQQISDAPLFLFGITMQNHGGYWASNLHEESQVAFTAEGYLESTVAGMNDYFAGLHAADQALSVLVEYFRQVPEETIIIYFGDHMSDAGTKVEKMLQVQSWYDPATFSTDVESHIVPYLVWSNTGMTAQAMPMMEIGQLLPMVLEQSGVEIPDFWRYLLNMQETYSAFNKRIVVNTDQSVTSVSDLTPEQQKVMNQYRLLAYDYVWGQRYAQALWEIS